MESIILLIVIMLFWVKINDINSNLLFLSKKIDSLQYDINSLMQGNTPRNATNTDAKKTAPTPIKSTINTPIAKIKPQPKEPSVAQKLKSRFGSNSIEDFVVGNLLLNISIVTFVLGIGFFLKYSIDQNWIPIWGRLLIGVLIAFSMLLAGVKTTSNSHKLFSEGLFGGGIAILYITIFAGFALKDFAFLSFPIAFGAMVLTTILAGVLSVRYNSMATAIFGLIGGFLTPFLIHTDTNDVQPLMVYIFLLNLGVLYISISKKWSLLNWLSFAFTALIELKLTLASSGNFYFLLTSFSAIFILYSIIPFIKEIREKQISLQGSLVRLFGTNLVVYLTLSANLFHTYNFEFKMTGIITLFTAFYLLVYAYVLKRQGIFTKNLYFILIAQAVGLLLITPAIIFEGNILSAIWAIQALLLYWVSSKSAEKKLLWFSLLGFGLSFGHYVSVDLVDAYNNASVKTYFNDLIKQTLIAIITIGAFFIPHKLKEQNFKGYNLSNSLSAAGVFLLFAFINVQVINNFALFMPKAQQISITLVWVIFGILLFVFSLKKDQEKGKNASILLIIIAILKAFFIDLADADALYRIILFTVVGALLFVLAYYYKQKIKIDEKSKVDEIKAKKD